MEQLYDEAYGIHGASKLRARDQALKAIRAAIAADSDILVHAA